MPQSNKQARRAAESTARERAAAIKAQAAREESRHKLMIRGGISLVVVAAVAGIAVIGLQGGGGEKLTGPLPHVDANGASTAPPWVTPANTAERVALAGLTILPQEAVTRHDHVHVDIWADGKSVPLPGNIGIEVTGQQASGFAPLHTHDASGVVHIEAPDKNARFTLGQVFNEWNVKLSSTELGSLKSDATHTLTYYVNGKQLATDPAKLELKEHQEIAMVYGTADENKNVKVPATYKWTKGL